MKKIILFLSIIFIAGIAFVSMYNSIIDIPIWMSDIPDSVALLRKYYHGINQHDFFKIFSPVYQM